MNLFEFLNAQDGTRLFFYGLIFILAVGAVTDMVIEIFRAFNKNKKS